MRIFFLIIGCFIFLSCIDNANEKKAEEEITLPGKIAVSINDTCFIYDNTHTGVAKFKARNDEHIEYGNFTWINKQDSLLGIEYIKESKNKINQRNIACFDLNGNIISTIYEAGDSMLAGIPYLSKKDNRLLFTLEKLGDFRKNPFAGLSSEQSVVIMDFDKKEILKKIEKIGRTPNFTIDDSPWLFDETRFLYSIVGGRQIIAYGKRVNPESADPPGVYIYNITTDQKKLLIRDGHSVTCSPVDIRISYIKDQSVYVKDLKDNSEKILYTWKKGNIPHMNWSPDGKFIYMLCYNRSFHGSEEKLIEVTTGKETPFKKIHHGFYSYTWK